MERFKRSTHGIRHRIARFLAPRFYEDCRQSLFPRPMILFCKEQFKDKEIVGCEIGVYAAANAESIMQNLNVKKLYLIDPYFPYYFPYSDSRKVIASGEEIMEQAKDRMKSYGAKIVWIRKPSIDAVEEIQDALDFVYVDGNHEFEAAKNDLSLYYEKLKVGGIIGGHDFSLKYYSSVVFAAVEFALERGLKLYGDVTDFWVVK